jgi:hypothetical protein
MLAVASIDQYHLGPGAREFPKRFRRAGNGVNVISSGLQHGKIE